MSQLNEFFANYVKLFIEGKSLKSDEDTSTKKYSFVSEEAHKHDGEESESADDEYEEETEGSNEGSVEGDSDNVGNEEDYDDESDHSERDKSSTEKKRKAEAEPSKPSKRRKGYWCTEYERPPDTYTDDEDHVYVGEPGEDYYPGDEDIRIYVHSDDGEDIDGYRNYSVYHYFE